MDNLRSGGNWRRAALLVVAAAAVALGGLAGDAGVPGMEVLAGMRAGGGCDRGGGDGDAGIAPHFVRVRIVANSDSAYDQRVKELVRDAVRELLGGPAEGFLTADEAIAGVERMLPDLREEIAAALAASGCPYDCNVEAGRMPFPAKSYGGLIVPPGEYPALCVTLGQGSGANWWCVLFPPLCFVDVGSSLAVFADPPAGEETAELRADLERAAARPQLRSWLWEKLRESGWLKRLLGKAEARDAR